MKKQTLPVITLLMITILSACRGQAPQTTLEPVAPTETVTQPTVIPADTATFAPTPEAPTATEAPTTESDSTSTVSYANDIVPILEMRCFKCHGIETTKEGLDMLTYENLMAGSRNGPVLVLGNANESLLVQLIVEGEMPNRGDPVTPDELQLIIDWINQGALNN